VLTTYADDVSILDALRAGARGYLTKNAGRDDIARAIHGAVSGQSVLDSDAQATLLGIAGEPKNASARAPQSSLMTSLREKARSWPSLPRG
jgi:DNA-binding NarL/FixJ family response regulator